MKPIVIILKSGGLLSALTPEAKAELNDLIIQAYEQGKIDGEQVKSDKPCNLASYPANYEETPALPEPIVYPEEVQEADAEPQITEAEAILSGYKPTKKKKW